MADSRDVVIGRRLLDEAKRRGFRFRRVAPGPFPVLQYGPRRLFDEAHRAHTWWVDHDRPGIERWEFTITAGGQRIALAE